MFKFELTKTPQFASTSFSRKDMLVIGARAISSIQQRCLRGRNANDRPMKPLSKKYAEKKAAIGQQPVRNMQFSGAMLGSLTVVEAADNRVVLGFTRREELAKAQKNQLRSKWFGLSKSDQEHVVFTADRIARKNAGIKY